MNAFLSSEVTWAAVITSVIGWNLASWYASRVRLRDWAESIGVQVVKKEAGLGVEAPKEISYRARRTGAALRVVVLTPDQQSFTGWVDVGGLFAALRGRAPKVLWEGVSPKQADPVGTNNDGAAPRRV